VDVGYFRRWYGNFRVNDNIALAPGDFTAFTVTAPDAAGLSSAGQALTVYDANRVVQAQTVTTRASNYGKQLERWNGIDVGVNARPREGLVLFGGVSTGKTMSDNCEIVEQIPESLAVAQGATTVTRPREYCRMESPFLTQIKANGAYTIPRADVLVSATFQSIPGPVLQANFVVTQRAPGVPLVGSPTATVALLPATGGVAGFGTEYGERLQQVDLRVGKLFRLARTRTTVNLDVFNLFNGSAVTAENASFPAAFRRPTQIMLARFVKISAQFDF
jgi:hypothetical protein